MHDGSDRSDRHAGLASWARFLRQFLELAGPYWRSERRWWAALWLALLIALTVAQAGIPLAINLWIGMFFDALENRELSQFGTLVGILILVIGANAVIVATHLRVKRRLQVEWRSWLTRRLVDRWMASGRHYQLSYLKGEHDNPDGRIAEDARVATELAVELGHSLLYCVLLLAGFAQVLWIMSGPADIAIGDFTLFLPGHLVWIALVYALAGTVTALLLGRALVRTAERRQGQEAEFRFGLAHARGNTARIAFARAEDGERGRFYKLFGFLVAAWDAQTRALANMYYYNASWSVLTQVFPLFVAAPRYITGLITLGALMQTAQAFQHMVGALSWVIDHVSQIAEWRASVQRVIGLSAAFDKHELKAAVRAGIRVSAWPEPRLNVSDLTITKPNGEVELSICGFEIHQGERVLVVGEPGAAVLLGRAIAGLWRWGDGEINVPESTDISFLSDRPYLLDGTLRDSVTFPAAPNDFPDAAIRRALFHVGLGHLIEKLDQIHHWEHSLSANDQQRLAFARLLLHRPEWILLVGATDALGAKGEREIMTLLRQELPSATLIVLGHAEHPQAHYHRHLTIEHGQATAGLAAVLQERTA